MDRSMNLLSLVIFKDLSHVFGCYGMLVNKHSKPVFVLLHVSKFYLFDYIIFYYFR